MRPPPPPDAETNGTALLHHPAPQPAQHQQTEEEYTVSVSVDEDEVHGGITRHANISREEACSLPLRGHPRSLVRPSFSFLHANVLRVPPPGWRLSLSLFFPPSSSWPCVYGLCCNGFTIIIRRLPTSQPTIPLSPPPPPQTPHRSTRPAPASTHPTSSPAVIMVRPLNACLLRLCFRHNQTAGCIISPPLLLPPPSPLHPLPPFHLAAHRFLYPPSSRTHRRHWATTRS